jgi:hypothetical protein
MGGIGCPTFTTAAWVMQYPNRSFGRPTLSQLSPHPENWDDSTLVSKTALFWPLWGNRTRIGSHPAKMTKGTWRIR